eukprot:Clim_evm49s119 gene=Clim_evmTU49s119
MSHCESDGKDKIIYMSKADEDATEHEEDYQGAIRPDGSIDWDCPCLQGMAHGPCGEEFRSAFGCFVNSEEDPKGADCVDYFRSMQECMANFPEYYNTRDEPTEEGDEETEAEEAAVGMAELAAEAGKKGSANE